jgi:hypothetical protein
LSATLSSPDFSHSFRLIDECIHASFEWINGPARGFAILRPESRDRLVGAWWMDDKGDVRSSDLPAVDFGAPSLWLRRQNACAPKWATDLHALAAKLGVSKAIQRLQTVS